MNLAELARDWTRLGEQDPLWAVYVAPDTRGGGWDVEEFLAVGRREVDAAFAQLPGLGLNPGRRLALDFGCGVGRLSAALAGHVDRVLAVDVAESMLDVARRMDRSGGRVRFVLNQAPDLSFVPSGSVDIVYSSLVLQHLPPTPARGYLREFARVLAPDGAAIVQVASRPTRSVKGLVFRWAPWPQRLLRRSLALRPLLPRPLARMRCARPARGLQHVPQRGDEGRRRLAARAVGHRQPQHADRCPAGRGATGGRGRRDDPATP